MADGERGAAVVETVLILPLLIALLLATVALAMAAIAKALVTNAARDAARVVAIECGQGDPGWYVDAQAAAVTALASGLPVGSASAAPARPGEWAFQAWCPQPGQAGAPSGASVTYAEINLFPPLAPLLSPGAAPGPRVFVLEGNAIFPEE